VRLDSFDVFLKILSQLLAAVGSSVLYSKDDAFAVAPASSWRPFTIAST
jgi:hypothetical protein